MNDDLILIRELINSKDGENIMLGISLLRNQDEDFIVKNQVEITKLLEKIVDNNQLSTNTNGDISIIEVYIELLIEYSNTLTRVKKIKL